LTFKEVIENWQLCGMTLTQAIFERAAPLAKTPRDREKLQEILDHYKEEVMTEVSKRERLGHDLSEQKLVLQISLDGLYAGPLLHGRFQVMGSLIPKGTFYLVDHTIPDLLVREGGPGSSVARFDSIERGEEAALKLCIYEDGNTVYSPSPQSRGLKKQRTISTMAKKAELAVVPAAPASKTRSTGPSAASRFRELIMAGKLTDDEIFATVAGEYNLDEGKRSYVAWYRNDLVKKGENPPVAKGGAKAAPAGKPVKAAPAAPVAAAPARGRKPAAVAPVAQKPMGKTTATAPVAPVRGRPKKTA
jgi:hypothetical protein